MMPSANTIMLAAALAGTVAPAARALAQDSGPASGASAAAPATAPVDVFKVTGLIDAVLANGIDKAINRAANGGSQALVLQLNSKGAVGPVRGSGLNWLGAAGGVPLLKLTRSSSVSSIGGKSSEAGNGRKRLSGSGLKTLGASGGGPAVISCNGFSRSRSRRSATAASNVRTSSLAPYASRAKGSTADVSSASDNARMCSPFIHSSFFTSKVPARNEAPVITEINPDDMPDEILRFFSEGEAVILNPENAADADE